MRYTATNTTTHSSTTYATQHNTRSDSTNLVQRDGEGDELRVALDHLLEAVLLDKLVRVFLQPHGHLRAAAEGVATRILGHSEGRIGGGLPVKGKRTWLGMQEKGPVTST